MGAGKTGKVYFVGGGPGDPGLMTVKGMGLLKRAGLVLAPGVFTDTYAQFMEGKEHFDPFDYTHKELVAKIDGFVATGGDAVFLVPGDLAIFSPVQSIIDYYGNRAEVVPGVSTLNASSAILKHTFDMPGISHSTIATSPKTIDNSSDSIAELSKHRSTMVLFMVNRPPDELAAELMKGYPPDTPVAVIYDISLPGEELVMTTLERLAQDVDGERFVDEDVYKLVVVGRVITSTEDPAWWDRRKEKRDARHAERDNKAAEKLSRDGLG